jgi:hypothetical protein
MARHGDVDFSFIERCDARFRTETFADVYRHRGILGLVRLRQCCYQRREPGRSIDDDSLRRIGLRSVHEEQRQNDAQSSCG